MIDPRTLDIIREISTSVAVVATLASVLFFVRGLYRRFAGDDAPSVRAGLDEGPSVLVKTPNGQSKRVSITLEEANQLLQR